MIGKGNRYGIDTELPPNSMTTLNLPILQDRLINQMFDK